VAASWIGARVPDAGGITLVIVEGDPGGPLGGGIPHARGPLASLAHALLRDDLDHTARGVGPIQGGRGWSLDDLDPLDVVGAEEIVGARKLHGRVRDPARGDRLGL